ncbi:MAG: alkyl sulfatase dimerization domain-containing protein [Lachnospiraceae bacterium]
MGYALNAERKSASEYTKKINQEIRENLDPTAIALEDLELKEIKKHLIFDIGEENISDENGNVLWSRNGQQFLKTKTDPDSVNPYLWRTAQESYLAGVYQLSANVYLYIGISNAAIAFVRSKTGWVILDTGTSITEGKTAIQIVEKTLKEQIHGKVKAIFLSHTHTDHVSGIEAFVSKEEIGLPEEGKVPIFGPMDYEASLVDENLYTGIAMNRRIQYQIGFFLPHDEKGWVSMGYATTFGVPGEKSNILPNQIVEDNGSIWIDGTKFTIVLTPETETKAHMCIYIEDENVLYLGDNSVGVLHNIYTMRGAQIRNGNFWGKIYYQLYRQFGEEVEVIFAGHGLPHFRLKEKPDNLKNYLLDNAVSYKYTHDQALLLANEGYSIDEVQHHLQVPDSIKNTWYTRPHYGNYAFNAKGTVQKYLGFYDGNPVNLVPLEKAELAEKLISYIGDETLVLEKAKTDFLNGEYQWVATITSLLVYQNPKNMDARFLCADALEQLGYQTDNALFRNAYLSGAMELRDPDFAEHLNIQSMDNKDVIPYVSVELILDYLGINFDGSQAADVDERLLFVVENEKDQTKEYHAIHIYKGTILHDLADGTNGYETDEIIFLTKQELYDLATKQYTEKNPGTVQASKLQNIQSYVVDTSKYKNFNLIEPIKQLQKREEA